MGGVSRVSRRRIYRVRSRVTETIGTRPGWGPEPVPLIGGTPHTFPQSIELITQWCALIIISLTMTMLAAGADRRGGLYSIVGVFARTICFAGGTPFSGAGRGMTRRDVRSRVVCCHNDGLRGPRSGRGPRASMTMTMTMEGLVGIYRRGSMSVRSAQTPRHGILGDVICGDGRLRGDRGGGSLSVMSSRSRSIVSAGWNGMKFTGVWHIITNVDWHGRPRGVESRGSPTRLSRTRVGHRCRLLYSTLIIQIETKILYVMLCCCCCCWAGGK